MWFLVPHWIIIWLHFQPINTDNSFVEGRKPRLFTFETTNDEITIEMAFSIPFVRIPVKKSIDSTFDSAGSILQNFPSVNFNVGAVVLSGGIIAASAVLPWLFRFLILKNVNEFGANFRSSKATDDKIWHIMNELNTTELLACTSRISCWLLKNSQRLNDNEKSENTVTDLYGFLNRSSWIWPHLEGTFFKDVLETAMKGENCSAKFSNCKITQNSMRSFIDSFLNAMKSGIDN